MDTFRLGRIPGLDGGQKISEGEEITFRIATRNSRSKINVYIRTNALYDKIEDFKNLFRLLFKRIRKDVFMAKQKGNGLQSSAGLMRYFDADKKAITFKPIYVLVAGVFIALFVLIVSYFYGTWPLQV